MASSTVNAPQLTEQQVQHILVQPLQQASVFLAAGPRIFDVTRPGSFASPSSSRWPRRPGTARTS